MQGIISKEAEPTVDDLLKLRHRCLTEPQLWRVLLLLWQKVQKRHPQAHYGCDQRLEDLDRHITEYWTTVANQIWAEYRRGNTERVAELAELVVNLRLTPLQLPDATERDFKAIAQQAQSMRWDQSKHPMLVAA